MSSSSCTPSPPPLGPACPPSRPQGSSPSLTTNTRTHALPALSPMQAPYTNSTAAAGSRHHTPTQRSSSEATAQGVTHPFRQLGQCWDSVVAGSSSSSEDQPASGLNSVTADALSLTTRAAHSTQHAQSNPCAWVTPRAHPPTQHAAAAVGRAAAAAVPGGRQQRPDQQEQG